MVLASVTMLLAGRPLELIMWTTLGLLFGVAARRQFAQHRLTS